MAELVWFANEARRVSGQIMPSLIYAARFLFRLHSALLQSTKTHSIPFTKSHLSLTHFTGNIVRREKSK